MSTVGINWKILGKANGGSLVGNEYIELNYDTDKTRHNARNSGICPSAWKSAHMCPEPDQPNTVPGGTSYGNGSYAPARFIQTGVKFGDAGFHKIANAQGADSGMGWTCDEWPPAM